MGSNWDHGHKALFFMVEGAKAFFFNTKLKTFFWRLTFSKLHFCRFPLQIIQTFLEIKFSKISIVQI